jgi:hypothetical protein
VHFKVAKDCVLCNTKMCSGFFALISLSIIPSRSFPHVFRFQFRQLTQKTKCPVNPVANFLQFQTKNLKLYLYVNRLERPYVGLSFVFRGLTSSPLRQLEHALSKGQNGVQTVWRSRRPLRLAVHFTIDFQNRSFSLFLFWSFQTSNFRINNLR